MAQGHPHPGQQLTGAKGLGEIIVGPHVQGAHLVRLLAPGGDHDDRDTAPLPQADHEVQAIHVRQTQVQEDHIRPVLDGQVQPLLARGGFQVAIAAALQGHSQEAAHLGFVLHQEDQGFGTSHPSSGMGGAVPRGRVTRNWAPPWG